MSIDSFKDSNLEQNSCGEKEKIFQTKDDLVVFEIKNNCSANVISRKLKELKQLEQDLEEIKEQEKELGASLLEDDKTLRKIEELKQWLKENTIKHIVKKGDTLWDICEKYYKHGIYSKILTSKLGYKILVIPGEILHIPSEKWMKKLKKGIPEDKTGGLPEDDAKQMNNEEGKMNNKGEGDKEIDGDVGDRNKETTHPEPVSEPKQTKENLPEQTEQEEHKEDNQSKETFEQLEQEKTKIKKEYLLLYAQYLENFANNMNFAPFRDDYKNLKDLSKYIKDNIENINLWRLKTQFNEKLGTHHNITEGFKQVISALENNTTNIKEYETNIIQALRYADKNDEAINWNYEMPIQNKVFDLTKKEVLNENDKLNNVFKQIEKLVKSDPKQFIEIYENLPTKIEGHGHGRRKVKDFTKLNDFLVSILGTDNQKIIKKATKKFDKFYKEFEKEKHNFAEEQAEKILKEKKAGYYYDENMIERPNPNYDNMKKELVKQIEENLTEKSKIGLGVKLFDILKHELISYDIENKKEISQIQELYSQINGLRGYTSDKDEEYWKYWTKELLIQTAMMIPAIRIADGTMFVLGNVVKEVEKKAGGQIIKNTIGRQMVDKTVNGTIFTEIYNVEDTFRVYKGDLLDKNGKNINKWDIFVEKFKDIETTAKNIIMLGGLRFLHENKLIVRKGKYDELKGFEIQTIKEGEKGMIYGFEEKIGQKIENKYTSYVTKKIAGIGLETGVVYSLGSLGNVMFDEDILTQEDAIFGLAMVISLRASGKLYQPAESKVLKIGKDMIDKFRENKLNQEFPEKGKIENKRILDLITDKGFIKRIYEKIIEKFKNIKTILTNKDQRNINNFLTILVHKELGIKANEKLNNEDKRRIKYIVKELKLRLWEFTQNKWEQGQGGGGINHGYMPDARFGETMNLKGGEKLIGDIVKGLQEKGVNLKEEKIIKYVKDLIDKLVDKKFKQAEEEGHKVQEIDKKQLKEDLMGKYNQLVREIEKVGEAKTIEEKINKLIDRLKELEKTGKVDQFEYKEIIDALKEKIETKEIDTGNIK